MKLHRDIKIESVASDDATRSSITEPFLEIADGKGQLIATNGMALAIVPCEVQEGDKSGFVSAESLSNARKATHKRLSHVEIHCNDALAVKDGATFSRPTDETLGKFPNWKQCVPPLDRVPTYRIAFNARLLAELSKAMGTHGVVLEITDELSTIIVKPANAGKGAPSPVCDDAVGILMPCRLS